MTQEWLSKQSAYTIHKDRKKRYKTEKITVSAIDQQWCIDLMDVQNIKKDNDDIRYLFVCIDVFSRMLWVVPIKDKFHNTVIDAFKNIIKSTGVTNLY